MSENKCKYNRPHCEQIGCDCFKSKHTKQGLLDRIKAMSPEEQKLAVDRLFRALQEPIGEPDIDSMTNEQVHQYLLDNGYTEKGLERLREESTRLVRMFHSGYEDGFMDRLTDREARALLAAIDMTKAFMANVKDFDPATLDSAAVKLERIAGEER